MSDFESDQFIQWREAVLSALSAEHPTRFPDLPVFSLEDMGSSMRAKIEEYYHNRAWEYCHNETCPRSGSDYKVKKCAACGTVPGLQVLYCVRFSQKASLEYLLYVE
jgi:hypothetical protein